jgi:HAD superfamily hydrolase (TIGR01484 family)
MSRNIRLLSTDFDGTLVSDATNPVFNSKCMELIRQLQIEGTFWAVNTGRSVEFLESGLTTLSFPRPDFILTSERDVFRRSANGASWEAFGDWNDRCARDHAKLFASKQSILTDVIDFVDRQQLNARIVFQSDGTVGVFAASETEVESVVGFIDEARSREPRFHYQRNHACLRLCHANYHKGTALAELSRLIDVPREQIFAVGDHYNDIPMLDGQFATMPSCPANAIPLVKTAVRAAAGYVADSEYGLGVYNALRYFMS